MRVRPVGVIACAFLTTLIMSSAGADVHARSIPPSFEVNRGQAEARALFVARMGEGALFLAADGFMLAPGATRVEFRGARAGIEIRGEGPIAARSHYLIGKDPDRWHRDIPHFERVRYREVWPGIDLVFHGVTGHTEFDLILAPHADPRRARLDVVGDGRFRIEPSGDVVIESSTGEARLRRPIAFQDHDGTRREVAARFVRHGTRGLGFALGRYDRERTLVIDPVISYSTFLGGARAELGFAIAVDPWGGAYVAGMTDSLDFPLRGAAQPGNGGRQDAFVTHLSPDGDLVYSTYLGGGADEWATGIAVDATSEPLITGRTSSSDFPTASPLQASFGGAQDAFVAKLDESGSRLVFSTYLGGTGDDRGQRVAVDGTGAATVVGFTSSIDFPTRTPLQAANAGGPSDVFITRLAADGQSLLWSTYIGGATGWEDAYAITVDAVGRSYVAGSTSSCDFPTHAPFQATCGGGSASLDAFVLALEADGAAFLFSTYLGGSGIDQGMGIGLDGAGNVALGGWTGSFDFPTKNAIQAASRGSCEAYALKLAPDGASLVFSTYLGGSGCDEPYGLAVDPAGNIVLTGYIRSADYPSVNPIMAFQPGQDAFVTKIAADGQSLLYSTPFGGSDLDNGYQVAVDALGAAYVVGSTFSDNFPVVSAFQPAFGGATSLSGDAFVTRIDDCVEVAPPIATTLKAVKLAPGSSRTRFTWDDLLPVTAYILKQTEMKGVPMTVTAGRVADPSSGVECRWSPEPIVYYEVVGASCDGV